MNIKNKYLLATLIGLLLLVLTGCSDKNGKLYTKREVMSRVKKEVTDEAFQLDHVDTFDEKPRREIYTFRSEERDFTFTAVNSLSQVYIDGPTGWYTKSLRINYEDEVREIYLQSTSPIWEQFEQSKNGSILYSSFAELKKISQAIQEADDIYKEELNYNTEKWLADHPLGEVSIHFKGNEEGSESIAGISINGSHTEEEIYKNLCVRHAMAVKDGKIEDPTTPQNVLDMGHVSNLTFIYVNHDNLSKAVYDNAVDEGLYNRASSGQFENGAYGSYYYANWDSYIMTLDVGLTDENYAPKYMKAYLDLLGYPGEIHENKGKITWKNGNDKWEMRATEDNHNNITSFDFYKNGKAQHIEYITSDSDHSVIHCTYVVGIRLEDFEKIFGVTASIDETERSLQLWQ